MAVLSRLVIIIFSSEFQESVAVALYCYVKRFIMHNGLVHVMGRHISQQDPRELEDIAAAFMDGCSMVTGPSRDKEYIIKDYIINMDQSPIPLFFL